MTLKLLKKKNNSTAKRHLNFDLRRILASFILVVEIDEAWQKVREKEKKNTTRFVLFFQKKKPNARNELYAFQTLLS